MNTRYTVGTIGAFVLAFGTFTAEAAPIGVPAATTGTGKTAAGVEVNILVDRDSTANVGDLESSQAFATGSIGLTDRVDLNFRLGFADFSTDQPTNIDTDIGPAFGVGFKTTWATIPEANLKIGSVFQTTRIRAEDNSVRHSFSEYDAALGAAFDLGTYQNSKQPTPQFTLTPFGGFAWSGVDLDGGAIEDKTFGLFLGLQAKSGSAVSFGAEIRLIDQTAIGLNVSVPL